MKVTIALIYFIGIISKSYALTSLQANEEKCIVNKNGEKQCIFEKILEISLNPENQQTEILLSDDKDLPMGALTLETFKTKAICAKSIKYFSRTYDTVIESAKRCPETGSCIEQKCSEIKMNEKLPEFNAANKYPGVTRCIESSSGWFAGCFYTTPACLFYRFFAMPVDNNILEIYECPKFDLLLSLNVKINHKGKQESKIIDLAPGITVTWKELELTLKSLTTPIVPSLNKNFVSDRKKAAILSPEIENELSKFKCSSKKQAIEFVNCSMDPLACNCHPADNNINCLCTELLNEKMIFRPENTLPIENSGFLIKLDSGEITAVLDLTAAQIQLKINGMKLKTQIELNTCKIQANVSGCYDCPRGAHVMLDCYTDFGSALATIFCPSTKMVAICSSKRAVQTKVVHFSKSIINEDCEVFCGAAPTRFKLSGLLDYPESTEFKIHAEQIGNPTINLKNWFSSFKQIDFNNLLSYLFFPKYFLIILFSLIIFFLTMYCLTPLLIKFFFFKLLPKLFLKPFAPRSVGNKIQTKYL
ncbi:unnamed protein product [Meloidogyne enterolobii]|uniref:Uncharacterized protein n=1 Tax=Meloidogyne enterolobii TaxID=390850 RepID=A0ACB0Z1D7_MELEN